MKFFNTAGPCFPEDHYMLPATERLEAFEINRLIQKKQYFVVHAPRQTGKTTSMLSLARELTESGRYISVVLSMEVGTPYSNQPLEAERNIISEWEYSIRTQLPEELHPEAWKPDESDRNLINVFLSKWTLNASRPLVIFLDEIDALEDKALIAALRQLRSGYYRRPKGFPLSLAVIGLRDVRDYKVKSGGKDRLNSPSPFNIAVRSITLRNFTEEEVNTLLRQHTNATGQIFTPEAMAQIYHLSQGQPWLVNSLAALCVDELVRDETQPILLSHVNEAKEEIIQRRHTHLDSLADKLQEPRVRHVIEPLMAGHILQSVPRDDIDYVTDLGLVKQENGSGLLIANPIYKEVLPRELASVPQSSLPSIQPTWLNTDGSLNPEKLLNAFLNFWRRHGQPLLESAPYHEIAPHLVMMAFLHRVVNGEGWLDREYAIGMGRMDMCLYYRDLCMGMELKVWRDGKKDPLNDGLEQLEGYLNGLGLETGWLVIFDQRSGLPDISERTTTEMEVTPNGKTVTVIRA
ncbi:MAG: AAA-like domain-containing protein [Chloroflexota bacterium]